MADYATHTRDGISGKGIFIALAVIAAFVVLLAVLGTSTVPPNADGAADPAAIQIAPGAISEPVPAIPD